MSVWLALSPCLVLLVGALVTSISANYHRVRAAIPAAAVLIAIALLFFNSGRLPATTLAGDRLLPIADVDLALAYSPGDLLLAILLLLAALAWSLLGWQKGARRPGAQLLVILAGAVAMICGDNWVTLAAGWSLAELGILAGWLDRPDRADRWAAWRAVGASLLGVLLLLAAVAMLAAAGSPLRLQGSILVGLPASLLLVAAWLRTGLYPFSFGPARTQADSHKSASHAGAPLEGPEAIHADPADTSDDEASGQAVAFFMGLVLLLRVLASLQGEFDNAEFLLLVALFSLVITTLLSLLHKEPGEKRFWAILSLGAPLFITPFLAEPQVAPAVALWLGLGFFDLVVLLLSYKLLSERPARNVWTLLLMGLAIACAAGFPGTPGLAGRLGLYAAIWQGGSWLYLILLPAALTVALIPLWRALPEEREDGPSKLHPAQYLALALLVIVPISEGLAPFLAASLFGRVIQDSNVRAFEALFRGPNPFEPIVVVIATLLPAPLSFWLARHPNEWEARIEGAPRPLLGYFHASAITRLGIRLVDLGVLILRQASTLIEQHPVGWILFAGLWVAVWLFNIR